MTAFLRAIIATLVAPIMGLALGCAPLQPAAPGAGGDIAPATIVFGGPIYVGVTDGRPERAEAVAFRGDAVIGVGSLALVEEAAGAQARRLDLAGAALFPGFTDAHAHLIGVGMRELTLNLEGVRSIAELRERVAAAVAETTGVGPIVGRGWIETGWPEGRMPTRDDLDAVSAGRPVILVRADGHALVANSAALKRADVSERTADPVGGQIERDEAGRATGVLIDAAQNLVASQIADPDDDAKREAFRVGARVMAERGWTGLHNMSVDPSDVVLIEELAEAGDIAIRVYNAVAPDGLADLAASGPRAAAQGRVMTRAVKFYVDGALGSRGAALEEPYRDRPGSDGLLLIARKDALAYMRKARAAGVQLAVHAIGDRANRLLLDWYEEALRGDDGAARWRIEHAQILNVEDIPRFAELGVIASMQPSHAIGDLFFADDRLGRDRLAGAYAWSSLLEADATIAGGSDAPVEKGDPIEEFYAATVRKTLDGRSEAHWAPDEALTRAESLAIFTQGPAFASFQENRLGRIAPGMAADFSVFSVDLMTASPEEIANAAAVMTIVDGRIVFDARKAPR